MSGYAPTSPTSLHVDGFGFSGNLGGDLNDTVVFANHHGHASIAMHVLAPTGGECIFEATFDDINWETITFRSIQDDLYTQTTDDDSDFIGSVAGAKKVRVRTSTAGSAPGTVIGSFIEQAAIIEGIEFGHPPHKFGYPPVHKDVSYSSAQTGAALWTPASGKKFVVTDLAIVVGGTTDGVLTIFDETNATGNRLFRGAIEVATNKQFVFSETFGTPYVASAADNVLSVTTDANMTVDIMVHGYEV